MKNLEMMESIVKCKTCGKEEKIEIPISSEALSGQISEWFFFAEDYNIWIWYCSKECNPNIKDIPEPKGFTVVKPGACFDITIKKIKSS